MGAVFGSPSANCVTTLPLVASLPPSIYCLKTTLAAEEVRRDRVHLHPEAAEAGTCHQAVAAAGICRLAAAGVENHRLAEAGNRRRAIAHLFLLPRLLATKRQRTGRLEICEDVSCRGAVPFSGRSPSFPLSVRRSFRPVSCRVSTSSAF